MKITRHQLIIAAIFFIHIVVNFCILKNSQVIKMFDEGVRVYLGIDYYRSIFSNPNSNIIKPLNRIFTLGYGQYHPHFFEFLEGLAFKILSYFNIINNIDAMILAVNSLFLFILLISVYRIGAILNNKNTGVSAAVLVSILPLVFGHTRVAMLDYPLMCMISLGFYLLLKTDYFQSSFYSVLLGIILGLSQLTKEASIIFILSPLVYYSIKSLSSSNKNKRLLNFLITLSFFMFVSGSVYLRPENISAFRIYYLKITLIKNLPNPLFYIRHFEYMIGPVILVLSLPLFINYLLNINKRNKFISLWFFIPILAFSISSNKSPRFLLPALPAFSLIVSGEIFADNITIVFKRTYSYILISASILQYILLNTGLSLSKGFRAFAFGPCMESGILFVRKEKYFYASKSLVDFFKKEAMNNNKKGQIVFLSSSPGEFLWAVRLSILLDNLPFNMVNLIEGDEVRFAELKNSPPDYDKLILNADYVVDKIGGSYEPEYRQYTALVLKNTFGRYKNNFREISKIKLSDASSIHVYKNVSRK